MDVKWMSRSVGTEIVRFWTEKPKSDPIGGFIGEVPEWFHLPLCFVPNAPEPGTCVPVENFNPIEVTVKQEQKAWLCCTGDGFNLAKGPLPPTHREGSGPHVWKLPKESDWLEIGLEPETASLLAPNHNLQPGQCIEIPPR